MSSCFNGDWHARQLRWTACLLALLASAAARAQSIDGGEPFISAAEGRVYTGTTPLRIWHRTRGYGQEASDTAIGGRWSVDLADAIGFVDGQFRVSNESRGGGNIGGGFRWINDSVITGTPRILGVSGWYDGQETILDNYFNQMGVSFESLGEFIDLRLNANIPIDERKTSDDVILTDDLNFTGFSLAQATIIQTDVSLRVVDAELAARIFDLNAWVYGGTYQMDGDGISETGAKGGVRGYVTNDLALDVGVTDDEVFGTNTVFQVIWTPGRTGAGPTYWVHNVADRMREHVYRNTYVATQQIQEEGAMVLTDAAGEKLRIVHVDSMAPAGGDGSFENPLNNLNDIQANSQQGDIILAHALSEFNDQTATLQDAQRFLGEGGGETHTVATELGTITIPETFDGATMAARPVIDNTGTTLSAVVLAGGNMEVETLAEIEVSNFDIMGGDHAISSPTGVGDVNINRLAISDANDHAIELTPLTETIANGTMRSRFTPTINDVTFTNIGDGLDGDDDDIHLAATTVETTIVETITVSDITSDDGEGHGINLLSPNRAATLTNINWDGGTTGAGGIRIQDAQAQGNVTLNGTNSFTGGETGTPDATGFAIALLNSAGTHTVTGTTITNMGGDSVIVNDGASNLNFTGRIEQTANNASVLSAGGEHTGTVTFTELTANAGVIEATTGDGLQFDDADGVYTFNDLVELAGTSMGVNAVNDSEAVLTFQNAEITNTTGVALNFDGGDANMTLTGRIEQTANNAAVLNVSNEHTGTLVLNEITANQGVIESTTGPGLVFDNADGAYTFNDEVLLNGGNAHVDVSNDSEGTFTFADGNITMGAASTDAAVVIDGSSAIFTYTGDITANSAATADAVVLNANTGGSVTFNSTVTGDEGVTVSNNSGGTFAFAGQVTLTGTSNGVEITNNTGGSTSFSNIDITKTGAGTGFVATSAAAGHTVTVTGASNTISTQTGVALNLDTIAVGGAGINFQSVSSDGAVNGITLNSLTGGAVNIGAGGAAAGAGGSILNSQQNGIVITNAANVSLNRMIVEGTNAAFDGIDVNHTNAATSTVSITNSEVHDGAIGIDYNRSASATSRLTLTSNIVDTVAAEGVAIDINGSGTSNITINGANQVTAGGDEALLLTTSGGSGKTVNVLVDDGQFMNNSAAVSAANVQANGTGTINATVTFNTFTNNNAAGTALVMNTNSPVALIRLNLDQNSSVVANGAATDTILDVTAGDFRVLDLADVDTRNVGDESIDPAIVDDPGPIPTP